MTTATKTEAKTSRAKLARLFAAKDWDAARTLALRELADADDRRERLLWLLNFANAEWGAGRVSEAQKELDECAELFDVVEDDYLKGNFHGARALLRQALGFHDSAVLDFTAANYYHEQAKRLDLAACAENNLAELLLLMGKPDEAVERAERALNRFLRLKDYASAAEASDTLSKACKALACAAPTG